MPSLQKKYHNYNSPPILSHYLKIILSLLLIENSFEFNRENYLQVYRMKMAIGFANLFMVEFETKNLMLNQGTIKPRVWKRYIDNIFSLCDVSKQDIDLL